MSDSNADQENANLQRLNRMEAVMQSMITLSHEQQKSIDELLDVIKASREEIHELLLLQREHRIGIMALFQAEKPNRERVEKLERHQG